MMRRTIVIGGFIAAALGSPANAAPLAQATTADGCEAAVRQGKPVADPVAAIRAVLIADANGESDSLDQLPKTARLTALLLRDEKRANCGDGEAALDYNYLTGAQESADTRDIRVAGRATGKGRMTVTATFKVFEGRSRTVTSDWVRGANGRWLLDDMSDGKTRLSRVLATGG